MDDFSRRRDGKAPFVIGNARQLENHMTRLVASVRGKAIEGEQLDLPREKVKTGIQEKKLSFDGKTINEIKHRITDDALKKHDWNKHTAAQELGLGRQGLAKKMRRLGISS